MGGGEVHLRKQVLKCCGEGMSALCRAVQPVQSLVHVMVGRAGGFAPSCDAGASIILVVAHERAWCGILASWAAWLGTASGIACAPRCGAVAGRQATYRKLSRPETTTCSTTESPGMTAAKGAERRLTRDGAARLDLNTLQHRPNRDQQLVTVYNVQDMYTHFSLSAWYSLLVLLLEHAVCHVVQGALQASCRCHHGITRRVVHDDTLCIH